MVGKLPERYTGVMKSTVIINPTSGNFKYPGQLRVLKDSFRRHGINPDILVTGEPGEATAMARRAAEAGSGVIMSVSGDGTVNEIINGIMGSGARLGIIPAGVSNVLARELGIDRSWDGAVRIIKAGRVRRIDLGIVNDRYFSLMVGIGFDAQAVKLANPAVKRYLKRYAYHLAGVRTVCFYRPRRFRIRVDGGREYSAYAVIVSNAHYYGGSHQVSPAARVDDGFLSLTLFQNGRRRDYLPRRERPIWLP
jgi:YegS/Rv2252/BmrU family lipid kinase